ncbi:hypothetical protein BEWA_045980 [Theileria equi strain WA]|uniref:Uncharacterized protein n=1 Tax=Theileria equi strain WA TaxID=1537102 RepID=L1LA54_THEEQ|nr:hypothetical protein BEWA_045980 [Theileria equi strain WA]EKX72134.1 hypothetical protein BEWA_045980 [Theileria equi strain WA]|eukprot:XP_004831586.1 hypothetical protein BEWA_045980 [Theileria equi strain WA]
MHIHRLDIGTRVNNPGDGIIRTENKDGVPNGYSSLKYSSTDGKPFDISVLYINGKPLKSIIILVTAIISIVTYCRRGRVLLVHFLILGEIYYYIFNPDTKSEETENVFIEFAPVYNQGLSEEDVKILLRHIRTNRGFNLVHLIEKNRELAGKLIDHSDLIFDISKNPGGHSQGYPCNIKGIYIFVDVRWKIGDNIVRVQHTPTVYSSEFHVKGIESGSGNCIKVKGGLPNDPITEFSVYYYTEDVLYENPIFITLKITNHHKDHIPGYYILSRNANGIWDLRQTSPLVYSSTSDIQEIARNIATYNRLLVDKISDESLRTKLGDIRQGLSIDLTKTNDPPTEESSLTIMSEASSYDSDGIRIPYKKYNDARGYSIVRHASTIPYFTVQSIRTGTDNDIAEDDLPPFGTLFGRLNVYYADYSYKNALLIELRCLYDYPGTDDSSTCIDYYYISDENNEWVAYRLETKAPKWGKEYDTSGRNALIAYVKQTDGKIAPERLGEKLGNSLSKYQPRRINVKQEIKEVTEDPLDTEEEDDEDGDARKGSIAGLGLLSSMDNNPHYDKGQNTTGYIFGFIIVIIILCLYSYFAFSSVRKFARIPYIGRLSHSPFINRRLHRHYT